MLAFFVSIDPGNFNNMYLRPSKILYTHHDPEINSTTERAFCEMSKSIHNSTVFPKLQIVKKDGFYFTLNDAKLQVYRHLEESGRCGSVEVEKVSLKEVPEGIRQLMTVPDIVPRYKVHIIKSKDKQRKGKYQSISTSTNTEITVDEDLVLSKCSDENDNDEVESMVSDNSDSDQSDFESSDWSDADVSDTDVDSSEEQKDEDDEERYNENESFI